MAIDRDTLLSRNAAILDAPLGDEEIVMMNVDMNSYYALNPVASRIWQLLETPRTIGQLCARIRDEFEVEPDHCEADVREFANQLLANGAVYASAP